MANSALRRCLAAGRSQASCEGSAIRQANSAVGTPARGSSNERPWMGLQGRRLTVNTALTVPPARLTLNNREYLTAPAVLIVAGVLNNALITEEALEPDQWNGIPVVCNHPMDPTGQAMSARNPDVLAQHGVGALYRAQMSLGQRNGKPVQSLRAEVWLDIAQVQALGGPALQAMTMLEAQQPLEVSTGFYSEAYLENGLFYGTPYTEVLHTLRPDHLALLPETVGACSWSDGCGCPRLNHTNNACACTSAQCTCQEVTMEETGHSGWRGFLHMLKDFVARETHVADHAVTVEQANEDILVIEQTDIDIREALYGCLAREMGVHQTPIFIESVDHTTQSFVYRMGERLCRRYWTLENDLVTLTEDREDVQRNTQYNAVPGTAETVDEDEDDEAEEYQMEKHVPTVMVKTRVNALIANKQSGWTDLDRPMLETFTEAQLIRLMQQPTQAPTQPVHAPETMAEAIATLAPHLREPMEAMAEEYDVRKQQAITILSATKECPFSAEEMQGMTAQRLEKIVLMSGQELPGRYLSPAVQPSNYSGRRMPQLRVVEDERDGVPPLPDGNKVLELQRQMGLRA